jgi:DNA-binding SARP family transcriptional activator
MVAGDEPSHRIYLFGGLHIEKAGKHIEIHSTRGKKLIAFLVLHPHLSFTREYLAEQLWPETYPERILRNFSHLLYRVKNTLGPGWFRTTREKISLDEITPLWVDVWEFEKLIEEGNEPSLSRAVSLYKGDLLPEIYDDWIYLPRLTVREKYLDALLFLGRYAEKEKRNPQAISFYNRLAFADPMREEAYRGLMRVLANDGRFVDAINAYKNIEKFLKEELDAQPTKKTIDLITQIKKEYELTQQTSADDKNTPTDLPFIGRSSERTRLLDLLDRAYRSCGGIVVVLGEPGIGKTRLFQELGLSAKWRGWEVSWGHATEAVSHNPLAVLNQVLGSALSKPRLQQITEYVEPLWLAIASRISPHIGKFINHEIHLPEVIEQDTVVSALQHLLRGLQQLNPQLLVLEDLHSCDQNMWSVLDGLRLAIKEMRILIIISIQIEELFNKPDIKILLEKWESAGETVITLSRFGTDELHQLVNQFYRQGISDDHFHQLKQFSGGNPLMAITMLEDRNVGPLAELGKQTMYSDLVIKRISSLHTDVRKALEVASAIGYRFDYGVWENVLKIINPDLKLAGIINSLERGNLIILEPKSYRFPHESIQNIIYEEISPDNLQYYHASILKILSNSPDCDAETLFNHANRCGDQAETIGYALQAGEEALKSFLPLNAIEYFNRALECIDPKDLHLRFQAMKGRFQSFRLLSWNKDQAEDLESLVDIVDKIGDPEYKIQLINLKAAYFWHNREFPKAWQEVEAGMVLAKKLNASEILPKLWETKGLIAREWGDYSLAESCFLEARGLLESMSDEQGEARMASLLGVVSQRQGNPKEALNYHYHAIEVFRKSKNIFYEAKCLSNLGVTFWALGDFTEAKEMFTASLDLNKKIGDKHTLATNLINLASIEGILGNYQENQKFLGMALELVRDLDDPQLLASLLTNLGETHRHLGEFDKALDSYGEALSINEKIGRRRGIGYVLHGMGAAHLAMGRLDEAENLLESARELRSELGELDNLMATESDLTLVYLMNNEPEKAWSLLISFMKQIEGEFPSAEVLLDVHYTAHCVYSSRGEHSLALNQLALANQAMMVIAAMLPPEAGQRFLSDVPRNRQIQNAVEDHTVRVKVPLVRNKTPLGRKLVDSDFVLVYLTIRSPEDVLILNKGERRRNIIQRILREAASQDAAPTDEDLAKLFEVNRRTILRDMAILTGRQVPIPTRRRFKR